MCETVGALSPYAPAPAEEGARKTLEALGVGRRAADQHVGLEPHQRSLVVIILAARPAREGLGLARRDHRVERRILDRAPLAPRLDAVIAGVGRPFGEHHLLRLHARAGSEHEVPEARLAFKIGRAPVLT